ncbi:hypothetical protein BT69DRAFT_120347 [Atractiella rhizophila]|nr:hypothetical protein BT69DRAFT_120347 [Atractiella rhizophila]
MYRFRRKDKKASPAANVQPGTQGNNASVLNNFFNASPQTNGSLNGNGNANGRGSGGTAKRDGRHAAGGGGFEPLNLPDSSDFRTSLILPHLTKRFTLLRAEDGSLVSLDTMQRLLKCVVVCLDLRLGDMLNVLVGIGRRERLVSCPHWRRTSC